MSKLDCFGNEQWIHEMLDFFIIGSERQQDIFMDTKASSLDLDMILKKRIVIKPRKIGVMGVCSNYNRARKQPSL
jgi:hypothetical protein